MKITRKEDKFILGSTVVDSTVLKGTPGLEKQLLTNALNLLKFPQRFGLTQDKGKELKFTSDIEQSGRILDVFSDAVWEYNPKTTVYERKGKLSEVFNNKSIIFNENTGKTYYLKDGKFKKISDLNFKVSRGDEVVRELENRVQDVEKRMGDSGNRFSIVSALPANPDKDTLYIVVGEGQIEDTELQGMDLTELTAKISECITSNLNMSLQVKELQAGEDAQNARMEEINGSFGALEAGITDNKTEITSLKSRMTTAETGINKLTDDLANANSTLSSDIQKNTNDIEDIKTDLLNLASSDTITALDNRLTVVEGDTTAIKAKNNVYDTKLDSLETKTASLEENLETVNGQIRDIQSDIENLASSEAFTSLETKVNENITHIASINEIIETLSTKESVQDLTEVVNKNTSDISKLNIDLEANKTAILDTLGARINSVSEQVDVNTTDISHIKEDLQNLASNDTLVNLTNRVQTNEDDIDSIQNKLGSLKTDDIEGLQEYIENNSGHIEIVKELPENPDPETLYLISGDDSKKITYQDLVECRQNSSRALEKVNTFTASMQESFELFKTSVDGDITDLSAEVNTNKQSISKLREDVDHDSDLINFCTRDVQNHETEILNIKDDVSTNKTNIQDLQTQTANLRTEVEACNDDINTNKTSISNLATSFQTTYQTIQTNFNGIQTAMGGLSDIVQTHNTALTEAQETIRQQKTTIEGLEARIQLLEAKLDMIDFDSLTLGGETYDIVVKK